MFGEIVDMLRTAEELREPHHTYDLYDYLPVADVNVEAVSVAVWDVVLDVVSDHATISHRLHRPQRGADPPLRSPKPGSTPPKST